MDWLHPAPVDLGHRTLTVRDGAYEQNSCLSTHLFVWLSLSLSAFWGRATWSMKLPCYSTNRAVPIFSVLIVTSACVFCLSLKMG